VSARLNSRREAVLSFSRAYISDTASSTANAARASNWRASHLSLKLVVAIGPLQVWLRSLILAANLASAS
jgi:hypothetical protein